VLCKITPLKPEKLQAIKEAIFLLGFKSEGANGFRCMRIREEQGSIDEYEMVLGVSERAHGQKIGDFKMEDCVKDTEAVLDYFMAVRRGAETLTQCVQRIGMEPFRKEVCGDIFAFYRYAVGA
jgi:sulfite reductase beta subunit-like hemoprotein